MITLPNLVTQTSKVSDAGSAVASDNLLGTDALPQGFITELGNRLLTLAQQQGVNTQSTDLSAEVDGKDVTKASLSALLQALDKPEALNALLQPENTKATLKSADDKDKTEASSLSASDLQNVQALFAMLPVAVEARNSQSASTDKTSAEAGATLNGTLLSRTLQSAVKDEQEAQTDSTSHKKSSDVLSGVSRDASTTQTSSSAAAASNTASTTASNSALSLDESFKQVLSTLSKPEERRDSQSDTVTALTSAPVSSSSTLTNSTATASTTPSTPMLNAQLGSNEWQQALSQQIVMFSRNGQQNAELRLHPEDLGAIQINLTLDKDQAQLSMVSSHSQVRAALEAALPQLRTALAESGINLGQSNVSSDAFAQSQNYQGQQEGRRDGQHGSFTLSQDSENEITPIAVPAALQARVTGNGAVDIFA
ncbi:MULTISPECIES: flagellar hook-length control protein FliK [unclassified Pantoea]|uniref:flagellar hook-length control protein FliK n=1 Tax=unclassified Pantoea TaxID=2630326 RepID=UPI001CD6409B|nr:MULTISPECIES: flagellar hook-length control protein FliK [unclassified Pantoea]MCA1176374.1 flagellar hook-length control protein FliK [Pantoea sp. alder69]MCA1249344.1 flagellar hook-length control protein FliK [Pantoea sp. alder70]MCA1264581.1 flagellar hook-length control protein FliK [Pantoea sp. alder81]